jgi:hypothetical protein
LILLLSVGWLPPYLLPSGACLCLGSSVLYEPLNAAEGYTKPGLRLFRCTLANLLSLGLNSLNLLDLRCDRDLFGNGPHESGELAGNGYVDHIAVFTFCHQSPVTFTEPELGLPTDVLDYLGLFFESQLQMSADLGRIAIGPGAFYESPSGMGVAGFGNGALAASFASRVLRGDQAQEFHQFSWIIETCQIANFSHHGDGHGELDAAQGLKRFNHWVQTPGFNLLLEFLLKALESFGVFIDGTDIFLKDDLLSRCGADDFREPAQVGRVPIGPAHVTDILPEQKGFETELGGFEIANGIFTSPGEIADGFIFDFGDIDHGEIT